MNEKMPDGHDERRNPFERLKVLELGFAPPSAWPGMMLSDLGAEVTRIDSPANVREHSADERRRAAHSYVNRNKRSIAIDLKNADGLALFLEMAGKADVIVEGFRPGVMSRLQAGYEEVARINPRIVYCSMSGFGQSGPYRSRPAHDLNFLSMAGVMGLIGNPGGAADIPLNSVADYGAAAMHAAFGIVAALYAREWSGRGQHVDISYLDTTLALLAAAPGARTYLATGRVPRRGEGIFCGGFPYYAIYTTRDAKEISIACTEHALWQNFCRVIGRPDFAALAYRDEHAHRPPNEAEGKALLDIQQVMSTRDRDEWNAVLVDANVCIGAVLELDEVLADPQVIARDMVVTTESASAGRVRHYGSAIKYSGMRAAPRSAAPLPGEHTNALLDELGLADARIASLRASGAVA